MSRTTEFIESPSRPAGAGWTTLVRIARRVAARAAPVLGWPGRVYLARQMMHALGRLGEHELLDIGLTRLDLHAATALPLDADPSAELRRRAGERRRGRR